MAGPVAGNGTEVAVGLVTVLGWAVAVVALFGATSVLARWCPHLIVAVVQLVLPWAAAGALTTAVAAGVTGRPLLAGAAALAVAAAAVVLVPKLVRAEASHRHPFERQAVLSVTFANLFVDNPVPEATFAQLLSSAPDVLVMTELTPELVAAFDAAGGATAYPHRLHREPITGEYAVGLFAREPLVEPVVEHHADLEVVQGAWSSPDGNLRVQILAAHPEAPVSRRSFRRWRRQLRALRAVLRRTRGPAIALGDFNAATLQVPYEDLLRTRFRDGHADVAASLRPSWGVPARLPRWVPTVVARLDHLLVSPEIVVEELADLDAVGSDHRPFTARLAVGGAPRGRHRGGRGGGVADTDGAAAVTGTTSGCPEATDAASR